jgi:hypothetical protein
MRLDLSDVDAQLSALGEAPDDALAIADHYAELPESLSEVDALLDALATDVELPARAQVTEKLAFAIHVSRETAPKADVSAPLDARFQDDEQDTPELGFDAGSGDAEHTPVEAPSSSAPPAHPRSGEISLGEPVQREAPHQSGEQGLPGDARPMSGAYALDNDEPELTLETSEDLDMDGFAPGGEVVSLTPPAGERAPAVSAPTGPLSLLPDQDSEPEPETSRRVEIVDALLADDHELPTPRPSPFGERDPDAEFDALFDEATSPSGIPTRGFDDDSPSADDLLRGLGAPKLPSADLGVSEHEAEAAMSELFEIDEGDQTDILDSRSVFGGGSSTVADPFPAEEELGSSEFEIVLDETGEAKDIIRSDRPPPPDPSRPQSTSEKRPSFLGRLFGKKDD